VLYLRQNRRKTNGIGAILYRAKSRVQPFSVP
jgi:hypothetical protein